MNNDLNLFDFSDYRAYLSAWLKAVKSNKSFNLSRLAEVAGVHPTFLSYILKGKKHLSLEQAALISDHLEHTKLEQDYFITIINLDRAGTKRLHDYWLEKKAAIEAEKNKLSKRFDKHRELSTDERAEFYSSWLYAAVWAATSINDRQTHTQIATRFNISRDRAEEVLRFLVGVGLCNEKHGFYSMGDMHIHVPNESPFVVKHHLNWRMKAVQKMDTRGPDELFFTSPMSMSLNDFSKVREKLNKLIKEAVDTAKDSRAQDVVCLNIDFFKS